MLRKRLLALGFMLTILLQACGPSTPEEKLKAIEEFFAKNIPISEEQKTKVQDYVEQSKTLIAEGKKEEADKALDQALEIVEYAEDADLYNKSD